VPPILPTLRGYRGSWLASDVSAGLTLAAIAVPEQMATSRLAGLPAATGLYAFLAGSVAFALLGPNRRMSVGADSTITPVFAAGVAAVAVAGTARYAHAVTFLALAVGALVTLVGVLRLGWIADFLPTPMIIGVLAGIALEILVRQIPAVLGLAGGGTTTIGRLQAVFDKRSHVNGSTVAIAVAVLAVVVLAERVDRRIPGALVGVVVSIGTVAAFNLKAHGVHVLGSIHAGLPSIGVPTVHLSDLRHLVAPALTVAFLCVAQTAATVRFGRADEGALEELNGDLVALGAGNLLAGLTGSFAVNASPPRTAVVAISGGRTQATSLMAAAVVVVVLSVSGILRDLPQATLGAILIYVATRLLRIGELRQILRFDRLEFVMALLTAAVVGFVGIEAGIAVAVLLALAQRVRLSARPADAVLGRELGTDHWIPADIGEATEQVPGVLVYLVYAPLWYGNANYVVARIRTTVAGATPRVHALVLDANGISDIDYTGARALGDLAADLRRQGIAVGVARTSHLVHRDLQHSGVLDALGPDHLFSTVQDAVTALAGPGR
jgi:SulP family sulfate permease